MAKKKEENTLENRNEANTEHNLSNTNKKNILSTLSVSELIDYEKIAMLICRRYENNIKMYDGSMRQSGREYEKYKKINELHSKILNEFEQRLDELIQNNV
jgi:hypothetical protein